MRKLLLLASLPLLAVLAGCSTTDIAIGAGAEVATAASEERGLGQAVDDNAIAIAVQAQLLNAGTDMLTQVDVSVQEGRVLLTGRVEKPAMRIDAVRRTWEVGGVKEVIDRIEVNEPVGFGGYVDDLWLAEKLRAILLVDDHVRSINYSIDCVAGTIYLMGIAQSQDELQRVIDHARDVPYVRGVVSYVRLKNDPARQAVPASQPTASAS